MIRALVVPVALCLLAAPASAACVNKYVHQRDGSRATFTLLTGMMTYDDAKELSDAIASGASDPVEWLSLEGEVIARQFGTMRVLRPMPVSCGDTPSGVVVQVVFPTIAPPGDVVRIHFDAERVVDFVAQKN